MTRFARSHGSKGANDKKPEDASSWSELRNSMLHGQVSKIKEAIPLTLENKEVEVPCVNEIETVWADLVSESNKKKKKKKDILTSAVAKNGVVKKKKIVISEATSKVGLVKLKKECQLSESHIDGENIRKQPRKKNQKLIIPLKIKDREQVNKETVNQTFDSEQSNDYSSKKSSKQKKRKTCVTNGKPLKKIKNVTTSEDTNVNFTSTEEQANTCNLHSKVKGNKKFKKTTEAFNSEQNKNMNSTVSNFIKKPREKKRRKAELLLSTIIINGKPVKVCPFDGFMVQAEDAERLVELRKSMTNKGIPKDEREKAIKLERRRAEKALARLKKQVCFHCRRSGHNLSECPMVAEDQRSTGICYKCGSTEHTHFQCKVSRGQDFRYADCFICKEQGHIAKQCPDNPRGLYPRGGACITCGDVTHLKKDCPKYLAEKEEETYTVGKRNNRALEALDEDLEVAKNVVPVKKVNKHIKF